MKPPQPVTKTRIRAPYGPALALLLLAAACGAGDGDDATAGTAATSASSAAASTAPASTAPAATAPAIAPPTPRASAREAVDVLLAAWRAGDRSAALTVADAAAVDALFAVAPETGEDRGCNEPPPGVAASIYCTYRLDAGQLQVRAAPRDGGFVVDQVLFR